MRTILILTTIFFLAAMTMSAGQAVVIRPGECGLFDGNGNIATDSGNHVIVNTQNNKGKVKQKCHLKGLENDDGQTKHFNYFNTGYTLCGITIPGLGTYMTDDWHETVSSSGNATLTCSVDINE